MRVAALTLAFYSVFCNVGAVLLLAPRRSADDAAGAARSNACATARIPAILREIAANPLIVGSLVGLALLAIRKSCGVAMPGELAKTLSILGAMATPGALLSLGASLTPEKLRASLRPAALAVEALASGPHLPLADQPEQPVALPGGGAPRPFARPAGQLHGDVLRPAPAQHQRGRLRGARAPSRAPARRSGIPRLPVLHRELHHGQGHGRRRAALRFRRRPLHGALRHPRRDSRGRGAVPRDVAIAQGPGCARLRGRGSGRTFPFAAKERATDSGRERRCARGGHAPCDARPSDLPNPPRNGTFRWANVQHFQSMRPAKPSRRASRRGSLTGMSEPSAACSWMAMVWMPGRCGSR